MAIPHIDLAQDFIQEWGFDPPVLTDLGESVSGEAVVHAVQTPSRKTIVGLSTHHLFTMDVESGKVIVVTEIPADGFLGVGGDSVFGMDDGARLWRFDLASGKIQRASVQLPQGDWTLRTGGHAILTVACFLSQMPVGSFSPSTKRRSSVASAKLTSPGRSYGSDRGWQAFRFLRR